MIEKPARSLVKAISWRVTGTLDTIFVSWFITRSFTLALSIGGVEVFTKLIIYYLHIYSARITKQIEPTSGKIGITIYVFALDYPGEKVPRKT